MKIKIKGKWISIEPKVLTAKEIDSMRIKSYKFNLNTAEGSEEYLKSEGIDIEQCVKDGLTVINGIKNKKTIL